MSIRFTFTNAVGIKQSVSAPADRADIGKTINTLRKGSKNFDQLMRQGGR